MGIYPSVVEVSERFLDCGLTLALAESCTGGLISSALVDEPRASEYFLGSVVTYSNHCKTEFLGVRQATLETFGAVSEEVALEMSQGVRRRSGADISLSTTGVAGPTGGATVEKSCGSVWIGLDSVAGSKGVYFYQSEMERNQFREFCLASALNLLALELSIVSSV